MPPTSRFILAPAGLVSLVALIGGVVGLVMALRLGDWFAIGFDLTVIVAGAMGVMVGLGRFRASHALALLCIGGAIAVSGLLAFAASSRADAAQGMGVMVRGTLRDPLTLSRYGVGALLMALSGVILALRRPGKSLPLLAMGAGLCLPAAIAAGIGLHPTSRDWLAGLPPLLLTVIAFVAFFTLLVCVSAGLHCIIRAFEIGRVDDASAAKQ
ncbi:MAG: hypothetical protein EA376_05465 [Phycisphaeraceae bacterium]|nr:MAG: hypothetical protein EA376_05465 [Phycisphaeraceae bacterium]